MKKYQYIRYYIPEYHELEKAYHKAQGTIIKCHDLEIQTVPYYDSKYPRLLKKIEDPPVILYVKGNYEYINNNSIAVVGTRTPTDYGIESANKISKLFA